MTSYVNSDWIHVQFVLLSSRKVSWARNLPYKSSTVVPRVELSRYGVLLVDRVYSVHSTARTTVYIVNCRVILFYVGCYATQTVRLPLK
jgi:hypothetical protein